MDKVKAVRLFQDEKWTWVKAGSDEFLDATLKQLVIEEVDQYDFLRNIMGPTRR